MFTFDSDRQPNRAGASHTARGKAGKPFFGYFVVLALILVCFCPVSFGMSCAGIFYPSLAEHFGVGTGALSYYSSQLQLSALIFLPIFGRLFGTVDARKLVCGATLLIAIVFMLLAHASSLWMFYVCSFLMGIGLAILLFLAPSTLVNRWFYRRAGFLTGIVMAFTGVGGVVWSSVGGAVINSLGWSAAYILFSAITAAIIPVCWLCIASHPSDKNLVPFGASPTYAESTTDRHAPSSLPGAASSSVFRTPSFILIFLLCALLNTAMYAYFIIPSYIGSLEIGAALPLLGATAASAAMAGQTVAKIILGFVGDRQPVAATCVALACGMAGILLLLVFPVSSLSIYAGACLFGIQYGIAFVMMPIFTRRAFGASNYANTYARVSMAASISSVVAGLAGGTIVDSGGGYTMVFAIVLAVSAAAIIMTLAAGKAIAVRIDMLDNMSTQEAMPTIATFIPSHLGPFVRIPEHAVTLPERIAGANAILGKDEIDLLSRKLRAVIDDYDASKDARMMEEDPLRDAGQPTLAACMPSQVDSFVRISEHAPVDARVKSGETVLGADKVSLLGRKLRSVIDALDRNDSATFADDVRFVYGS